MQDEAEYLRLQADRAWHRFRHDASMLVSDVLGPLDVRPFIRRRPWWSLGGAVLGGFVSGLHLGRRRRAPRLPRSGKLRAVLGALGRRARRVVRSSLGAFVMANLRATSAAAPPRTNGTGAPRRRPS